MSGIVGDNTGAESGQIATVQGITVSSSDPAVDTNPDGGVGAVYRFQLVKNGNTTPVRADSPSMSPTTQGRVPIGNVSLSPGNYQFEATQTVVGAGLAVVTILARYASPLN